MQLKFGATVGWMSDETFSTMEGICEQFHVPEFIVFCLSAPPIVLPKYNTIKQVCIYLSNYRHWLIKYSWKKLLFFIFFYKKYRYFKENGTKIYFAPNINHKKYARIIRNEAPKAVVVINCGILKPNLLNQFHNIFINAHAGKFPEYRGMNNVEWAYFENQPVTGTIHFIDQGIDTGDIILEEELSLPPALASISELREVAFKKTRSLLPKSLKLIFMDSDFRVRSQQNRYSVRYEMHPFLKSILAVRLVSKG
jgi:folate-dependent phosphoribosylglycinamide formyltransferase PurN